MPIFGICLGHQLLALAIDAQTTKLKYGHRGVNHPVKDIDEDRTYITSQNHGYAVVGESGRPEDRPRALRQPERRHGRGSRAHRPSGIHRAVSPRGMPRSDGHLVSV